jgi:hypothetical protein
MALASGTDCARRRLEAIHGINHAETEAPQ